MNDWKLKPIGSLGQVITGKTPPKSQADYFGGQKLFVSPKDLDWDHGYVTTTQTAITEKALHKFKNQVIPKDTVMFTSLSFAFGKIRNRKRTMLNKSANQFNCR